MHLTTLGILAGIWPCGIITLISELFISESKTQVYGCEQTFSWLSHYGKMTQKMNRQTYMFFIICNFT